MPAAPAKTGRDLSKLSPLHRQMYLSARRGAEWLYRMNGVKGRFLHGWLPSLNAPLEGDHPLRQAGAAVALARGARYLGEADHASRATQAVLGLLEDTVVDKANPQVRHPSLPSSMVNRVALASLIVLAIHELPAPGDDLLSQAEELCNYLRSQQQADGSLRYSDAAGDAKNQADPDGVNHYPGLALHALAKSHAKKPASWKAEVVRKAMPCYLKLWSTQKDRDLAVSQIGAYAEAYLQSKDKALAQAVFDLTDWLCGLQYERLDAQHPRRLGGFMGYADGKPVEMAPDVHGARCALALADACRVTRDMGDVTRHERYTAALERCLQFLTTLQYADADTQHFADWYRPRLLGGFHLSHQDGQLRIDYSQYAVCALLHYLEHVARIP
jgi:hypothetical protein